MSADLAVRRSHGTLAEQMTFARALSASAMLPAQYRGKPENLLWAISYAEMLGCHPLTAVTGVFVIDGKPSASAALISALVRRAGHKLRVTGDSNSATAQIIRGDDPDFTFEVTFTMDDAKAAKLAGKGVWQQYPASMLKARAITQCARDACEDALSGLHYTAEELGAEVTEEGIPLTADVPAVPAAPTDVAGQVVQPVTEQEHRKLTSDLLAGRPADRGPLPTEQDQWTSDSPPEPEKPAAVTDEAWLRTWREQIIAATTTGDLTVMWKALVSQHRNGGLTDADMAEAKLLWDDVKGDIVGAKATA